MKIYNYSNINGEYLGYEDAIKDPMDEGRFLIPSFATTTPPLDVLPDKVACFVDEKWEIFSDFRGKKQISKNDLNISVIDYIGDLKDDFYLITDDEIKQIKDGKIPCFDGNKLTISDRPLNDIKTDKKQEINQAREQARIDEGAKYDNDLFDIDERSQANITAIVSMLIANNIPDTYKSVYRSKTNINHELTKVQMVELGTVIGAKVTEIYQKSWTLKALVDNATTKEEIEVIKWNM